MMFDRTIRANLMKKGSEYPFGQVRSFFAEGDMVIGNLEGPITTHASRSLGTKAGDTDNTRFTFDPAVAPLLRDNGVRLVSLGNNHIADFGREGASSTRAYLESAGIAYVGDPFDSHNTLVFKEVQGITIAFTAYDEFIKANAEGTRTAITEAKDQGADFIVVLAHWGDEYETRPPPRIRQLAATFAARGADLIIGTHSHVIGESEDLGQAKVYYSLGNFIFDQYWDESVRCGLTVKVVLSKDATGVQVAYTTRTSHLERGKATTLDCPSPPSQTPNRSS
jgi:poly-gamma-glutamate synthesis protein (capsule biosynthesis protein)